MKPLMLQTCSLMLVIGKLTFLMNNYLFYTYKIYYFVAQIIFYLSTFIEYAKLLTKLIFVNLKKYTASLASLNLC